MDLCWCMNTKMLHQVLNFTRPLCDSSLITVRMARLWKATEHRVVRFVSGGGRLQSCLNAQSRRGERGRPHQALCLFTAIALSTCVPAVTARRSWLSTLPMTKTTSVNICFGNWSRPWNGTLTLFSVFVDQFGRTDLHSRINSVTITTSLLFLSLDSSVAPMCLWALQNSKHPDLHNIFTPSRTHP